MPNTRKGCAVVVKTLKRQQPRRATRRITTVRALFPADVLAWVQATQPKAWETIAKNHGAPLLARLRDQLDQRGTLDVLRHGIELLGLKQPLKLAEFKPALAINVDILARYAANRLRVVRQVRYSLHNENSIDLVLFLNGLPVATVELKTDFTRSIGDAIDQYRFDRLPRPKGQVAEPLLSFPNGKIIFPRFHQLDVTRKLQVAVLHDGAGGKYLVQHSAGSGKTNSIAWTAHFLAELHDAQHKKIFDTVLVVSDRNVIDAQLQEALFDFERTSGVVATITNQDGSKSGKLAEALSGAKKIVVCTIQTFPFALEAVRKLAAAQGKHFAVIADEAHSSQTGEAAAKLKAVLSPEELQELNDGGEVSTEDILVAQMATRADDGGITFVAFTATPKNKTWRFLARAPIPRASRRRTTCRPRFTSIRCARPLRRNSFSMCCRTTRPTSWRSSSRMKERSLMKSRLNAVRR
jgi:type I site-specific restriction-modification system R (restriction) subunit